jgi:rhamnosyltransferase subunit B
MKRLRVLIFGFGSSGDVYPAIGLGVTLLRRGHDVLLVANEHFRAKAEAVGLEFQAVGTAERGREAIENRDLWTRGKGFRVLFDGMLDLLPETYRLIEDRFEPGRTVLAANVLAFGARVAQEKLRVPLASLHLQPLLLRSLNHQPGVAVPAIAKPILRPLRRILLSGLDEWVLDPAVLPRLESFRASLGLPPVRRIFQGWIHSPLAVFGLFPEWFAPPEPDWPPQTQLFGFPLFDFGLESLPKDLENFLNAGPKPIVFTLGTAMQFSREFFAVSAEVCRRMRLRALFVTAFPDQLPGNLPDAILPVTYAPFSSLLPRCAALVHHGGIGTVSQALAAGIPQLIMPLNFDQPDNAVRVEAMGAGYAIALKRYRSRAVERQLSSILHSANMRRKCDEAASRIRSSNALEGASDCLESLIVANANQPNV